MEPYLCIPTPAWPYNLSHLCYSHLTVFCYCPVCEMEEWHVLWPRAANAGIVRCQVSRPEVEYEIEVDWELANRPEGVTILTD